MGGGGRFMDLTLGGPIPVPAPAPASAPCWAPSGLYWTALPLSMLLVLLLPVAAAGLGPAGGGGRLPGA